MSAYELAQLNIGIIKGPMDSPIMAEFAANLERINALADHSPGFVWRLQTEDGDATSIRPFEDENLLLNMSVWRDVALLSNSNALHWPRVWNDMGLGPAFDSYFVSHLTATSGARSPRATPAAV